MKLLPIIPSPQMPGVASARQQGAVLIVAMVILLVMTVLGVSSQVSSVLQQKMSTAYQQRNLAGLAAESALRAGEAWMNANVTSTLQLNQFVGNTQGLYSNYTVLNVFDITAPASGNLLDIADASLWTNANSIAVINYDNSVAKSPRYIIEYVGRDKGSGAGDAQDYNDNSAATSRKPHVFQISAIGWSRTEGIYQVLESTYRTGRGPGNFDY